MTGSPVDALAPLLADFADVDAHIRLGSFGSGGTANVHLRRGRHHAMCTSSPNRAEPEGDPELAPLAEVVATAAALWHKRFRSKTPKIELSIDIRMSGYIPNITAEASAMRSATLFGRAFNERFDELYARTALEILYDDRKLRSLRLFLDLLRLGLYLSDRGNLRRVLPLGTLAGPARELATALVGEHSSVISSIELSRYESEWEDDA
jgi:hypothetical protein